MVGSDASIVNASLAEIDRVFNQGKKNHYTLLGEKDKARFKESKVKKIEEVKPVEKIEAEVIESKNQS